jgi:hypothetical protein
MAVFDWVRRFGGEAGTPARYSPLARPVVFCIDPSQPILGAEASATPKSACAAVLQDCLPLRPVDADGITPVPVQSCFAYLVKDAHTDGCRLRHLDDRARVPLIEEIDEGAARRVSLLANLPAGS